MTRGLLFGHDNLLPLTPLDYQLNYAAHHLYLSFLLITGIRRNRALAKYNSRTSEKDQTLHRSCWLEQFQCTQVRLKWYDVNNKLLITITIEAEYMGFVKS